MALIGAIVLSFFLPWPWNLVVVLGGVILEVGEVIWGLRLARRWRPKSGPETMVGEDESESSRNSAPVDLSAYRKKRASR